MRVTLRFLICLLAAGGALAAAPDGVPLRRPDLAGEAREARDRPREANAFFRENRLPPGTTRFPAEKLLAAREHARRMPLHSARTSAYLETGETAAAEAEAQALTWTALGPGNVGGRTRALRISPSSPATMYAAGVAGGVWKSTNSGASWTPKGDLLANLAVSALALDPTNANVLYAGTGEGYFNLDRIQGAGIFKSTDGGTTWTQLAATAPPGSADFLFVNDLVVSANNHSVVYAATGTGLWRSTNAGSSWTRQIDAVSANGCMDIALRPALNPDTVIVSCGTFAPVSSKSGIWRSTNANIAAATWSHRLGAPGSGAAVTRANMGRTSLAIAPSQGATQYALIACSAASVDACGVDDGFEDGLLALYKSTDGGVTWSAKYNSTFDGGTLSDLLLTNPVAQLCEGLGAFNQGWYDNVIAVDPTNAERVFAGGIDLFRSDDGGASFGAISYWWIPPDFSNYAHADQHALVFHPNYNGTSERRLYVGSDGGLAVSTDAATAIRATTFGSVCPNNSSDLEGASWTSLNNGYGVTQFYHGTPYPSGTRYFAGTQDNGTLRGSDSGGANAWSEIVGGDGGYTAINPNSSGASTVLYAENTGISIQRSSNDGNSFSDAITGIVDPDCGRFINPFVMDPNNPARLYTSHNAIWRTANSAASWQQASAALSGTSCSGGTDSGERFSALAVADGDPNLLVAGTNRGRLCRLTNADGSGAGTAPQNCSTPAGTAVVSDVAFDPNDTSRVYASFSTIDVLPLWRSTNGGQTWTSIAGAGATGLPDVGAHSIAVSPYERDTIYVGTDVGVFVTTDGGATWARENTGFANVRTDRLVFNAVGAQQAQLFAFTHGRGTFRTTVPKVPPLADLSITKTDGVASVKAGAQVTYTIVASNPSTKSVRDVTVSDAFPPSLGACSWTCADSPNSTCDPSGTGNIDDAAVTIAAGGNVTYSATCTLSAGASGTLANTATVSYANDPGAANNTASDSDAIVPQANVAIGNSDLTAFAKAGATVTYKIVASNPAAVAIAGVGVADTFPAVLSGCSWTCSASSGGSCPASGSGNIATTVALAAAGGEATFTASCTLAASATGTLSNTATVTYANDPVAANNTATDTDTIVPRADVSVSKSDGATLVVPGSTRVYTIVVSNPSANAVSPVTVSDAFPAALTGCTWTCAAGAGGSCPPSGSGAIDAQVTLGAAAAVTFTATCTLAPDATEAVANTATATYANDPNPANDTATDTDTVSDQLIFADDFE